MLPPRTGRRHNPLEGPFLHGTQRRVTKTRMERPKPLPRTHTRRKTLQQGREVVVRHHRETTPQPLTQHRHQRVSRLKCILRLS